MGDGLPAVSALPGKQRQIQAKMPVSPAVIRAFFWALQWPDMPALEGFIAANGFCPIEGRFWFSLPPEDKPYQYPSYREMAKNDFDVVNLKVRRQSFSFNKSVTSVPAAPHLMAHSGH
jgi:hypothetical protein